MKGTLLVIAFMLIILTTYAQDSVCVFLNNDFIQTNLKDATIKRTAVIRNNRYCITDQYLYGKMINYGEFSSLSPLTEDGFSRHYNIDGSLYSSGNYSDGKMTGKWIYYSDTFNDTVEYFTNDNYSIKQCDSSDFKYFTNYSDTIVSIKLNNDITSYFINHFHLPARDRTIEANYSLPIKILLNKEGKISCIQLHSDYTDCEVEILRVLSSYQYKDRLDTTIAITIPIVLNESANENNDDGHWFVDENASFQGGDLNKFSMWVAENIQYPADASESKVTGKVIVQFSINKNGSICNIKIIRNVHPALDAEVIRVLKKSPKWKPARNGEETVKQIFVIPVVFTLQ